MNKSNLNIDEIELDIDSVSYEQLNLYNRKTKIIRGEYFPCIANHVLIHYDTLYSDPHTICDGDIVYCDTHQILRFKDILNKKRNLILITHNSDHYICDGIPPNSNGVSVDEFCCYDVWYSQNSYSSLKNVIPLPIGFENKRWELNFGPKTKWLNQVSDENIEPSLLIYLNCNVGTQTVERSKAYLFAKMYEFATVDSPNLSYVEYLRKIKQHKFTISPPGNGLDCHRTWEILMMKRVPILKRQGMLERVYSDNNIPSLFVNDWNELFTLNLDMIYSKFSFDNTEYLYFQKWKQLILSNKG
jgi:hypothetical protein